MKLKLISVVMVIVIAAVAFTGCGSSVNQEGNNSESKSTQDQTTDQKQDDGKLSGEIIIDGSSTVFPITEAVVEEFNKLYPDVNIPIGVSGTGGGFKKFTVGETDISNASRPIKDSEKEQAQSNGIDYIELKVAYDGLSVLVNPDNTWVDSITVEELNKIWGPDSTVEKWSDIRPEWPDEKINLYGPGTDSGTFDYFTEVINGESGSTRKDYTPSEDDNVLVQGIAGDKYAMGYFGFAYYVENKDILKALEIDGGDGAVLPDFDTIMDGTYSPLSRPIYIYVSEESLENEHVKTFVQYYLTEGTKFIQSVGYVPLEEDEYTKQLDMIE